MFRAETAVVSATSGPLSTATSLKIDSILGPTFITPGFIIACYAAQIQLPVEWKSEIARSMKNGQRNRGTEDSGWGM